MYTTQTGFPPNSAFVVLVATNWISSIDDVGYCPLNQVDILHLAQRIPILGLSLDAAGGEGWYIYKVVCSCRLW